MLTLYNVHTYYGPVRALRGISLSIQEKSITAVLGPNGAGKSTTLKSIVGLIPRENADEGEIIFNDIVLRDLPRHRIAQLGISLVPERREIFPELTVKEHLILGSIPSKLRGKKMRQEIEKVYELFPPLTKRLKSLASNLSGGEQQMLVIGMALMAQPKVLLLDEPFLGLAPFIVRDITQAIKKINQEGTTIVVAEENIRKAFEFTNYGYILENGEVVLAGRSSNLATNDRVLAIYLAER